MSAAPVTAALLIIGNEILSGRTQDANLAHLAGKLGAIGVRLHEARVIPDDEAMIVAAVNELRACHSYLFTTGGIGPTHDDITARCIARAFDRPFERNVAALERLRNFYGEGGDLNEARMSMADMPEGVSLIDNPVSAAPGFRLDNVFVMAGVPKIMQAMLDNILPQLQGGAPVVSRALVVGCGEGDVAEDLSAIQAQYPEVEIGSYPFMRRGRFGTTLIARGYAPAPVEAVFAALQAMAVRRGIEAYEGDHGVTADSSPA